MKHTIAVIYPIDQTITVYNVLLYALLLSVGLFLYLNRLFSFLLDKYGKRQKDILKWNDDQRRTSIPLRVWGPERWWKMVKAGQKQRETWRRGTTQEVFTIHENMDGFMNKWNLCIEGISSMKTIKWDSYISWFSFTSICLTTCCCARSSQNHWKCREETLEDIAHSNLKRHNSFSAVF